MVLSVRNVERPGTVIRPIALGRCGCGESWNCVCQRAPRVFLSGFVVQEDRQLQAIPIPIVKGFGSVLEPAFNQTNLLLQLVFGGHVADVKVKEPDP
jgi:hypothetical protein